MWIINAQTLFKKNKHDFYRGEHLTKTFCEDLIEHINNEL